MQITDLIVAKKNKNRSNLYIDGEFFCSVDNLTAVKNGLKQGVEISENELAEIIVESEKEKALSYAFGYLSKHRKTEKELKAKLTERGYLEDIIAYVLSKTKQYNFVNDEAYANTYVEMKKSGKGSLLIKLELKSKGVSEKILNKIEIDEEEELSSCIAIAKKYFKNNENTSENAQKLFKKLALKGFSFEAIKSAIRKINTDVDFEE